MLKIVKLPSTHLLVTGQHNSVFFWNKCALWTGQCLLGKEKNTYSTINLCTFKITEKEIQEHWYKHSRVYMSTILWFLFSNWLFEAV